MAELLKNYVNDRVVNDLAVRIENVHKEFDANTFIKSVQKELAGLELTERLNLIAEKLALFLPKDFKQASNILIDSLGEELDHQADDPVASDLSSNNGFIIIALTNYISRNGLQHFDLAMKALYEMTKHFSSEVAIRDFIIHHEQKTLSLYEKWVVDKNVHVRRLVCESLRPRLPWARQLPGFIKDPSPILPFLEKLKDDNHLYVRRSVANNLNDISKDNPEIVIDTLTRWNKKKSTQMNWLTKHALRTLIKKGHPAALKLIGISGKIKIKLDKFAVDRNKIKLGESFNILLNVKSTAKITQTLMIDYIIYHAKANGSLTPKVFKWTQKDIKKGEVLEIKKIHTIKKITTRKYYPGKHEIHVQINGKVYAKEAFELTID